jgi:hypothetical protein
MLATMQARVSRYFGSMVLGLTLTACSQPVPFAQLSGVLMAPQLDEISGMAASHAHPDTFWVVNDGGGGPVLYAIGRHGGLDATVRVANVANTDWEDLSSFDLDGHHYLLIADTGDNGGLRRTAQLHVVEEPSLEDGSVRPAWSIAFRWPDGPRDCEAVAVDVANRRVLLISKRHRPPELFSLPLRPAIGTVQVARFVGYLAGIPQPDAQSLHNDAHLAHLRHQITAAELSPDGRTLAVLTYSELLLYSRSPRASWEQAAASAPRVFDLPWLPQAEAMAWSANGRGLYATGEHSPAPLVLLTP